MPAEALLATAPEAGFQSLGKLELPAGLPVPADGSRAAAIEVVNAMMLSGPKWELGAMGPDRFFCWSMLQALELAIFGREVANVVLGRTGDAETDIATGLIRSRDAGRQWLRRPKGARPRHGDGVRMSHMAHHGHVGVWLDIERGLVAHLPNGGGFALDRPAVVAARGYTMLFYEWRG